MSTFNSKVKKEILDKVKSGITVKEVATQYGVSDRTIFEAPYWEQDLLATNPNPLFPWLIPWVRVYQQEYGIRHRDFRDHTLF